MFTTEQKRKISAAVQSALLETNDPQLPIPGVEIIFKLEVQGRGFMDFTTIRNASDPEMKGLPND
jgi:hypothetical protein